MENFKEGYHLHTIKHENRIYSAAQDGKVAFISAFDIANVATHALLDDDKRKLNKDYIITGREALDYDEVSTFPPQKKRKEKGITNFFLGRCNLHKNSRSPNSARATFSQRF